MTMKQRCALRCARDGPSPAPSPHPRQPIQRLATHPKALLDKAKNGGPAIRNQQVRGSNPRASFFFRPDADTPAQGGQFSTPNYSLREHEG